MNDNTNHRDSSMRTLRALVPNRRLTRGESIRIAELQANRLLELFQISGPKVPSELITEFPRISVRYEHGLPMSGSAHWENGLWVITLNADEPYARRRFSLMHEFKHVLDHNVKHQLYGDTQNEPEAAARSERAADHFAACLLMPKRWLKSEWFASGQQLLPLAMKLHVSTRALSVRLWHLGIAQDTVRCPGTPRTTVTREFDRYFRWPSLPWEAVA